MLIPTPIVAIDDVVEHTDILASGLACGGAGLIPLSWNGRLNFVSGNVNVEFNTKLSGVRIVFCDFHLQKAKALSDKKTHHDTIAVVIDDIIAIDNGPFVLIVWTKHPNDIGGLEEYLVQSTEKHCHPLAIIPLAKEPYLSLNPTDCAKRLAEDISRLLKEKGGAVGLWFWERSVMKAAGQTVTSISAMASGDSSGERTTAIKDLLWRLAVAALGEGHVPERPAYALNEALAPILYDRLTVASAESDALEKGFWRAALGLEHSSRQSVKLGLPTVANINTVLHIANEGDAGKGSDRGAVIIIQDEEDLVRWTGIQKTSINEFIKTRMKVEVPSSKPSSCRLVAVQIQAACDFAQKNDGLFPFVLGVETPAKGKFIHGDGQTKLNKPEFYFCTPTFMVGNEEKHLCLHPRFIVSLPGEIAALARPVYRLREALINQAAAAIYGYGARSGIVFVREGK